MKRIAGPLWNIKSVEKDLKNALLTNSEIELRNILNNNTFLFYLLYPLSKNQPIFKEVSFGNTFRCDFAWLRDNSYGPEWVLMELKSPNMKVFKADGNPTAKLYDAIEQLKKWKRYFDEYPYERKRIFGPVVKFTYLLVAGSKDDWQKESTMKWRADFNLSNNIKIRTTDAFSRALKDTKESPDILNQFKKYPKTLNPSKLVEYLHSNNYIKFMSKYF